MESALKQGSFLAVRSPRDSFYLCRVDKATQLNFSEMIEVTWLEKKSRKNNYILGKKESIMGHSVICEIKLNKISRFVYILPEEGRKFILQEIKYILEQQNAVDSFINDSVDEQSSRAEQIAQCENESNESIPIQGKYNGNEAAESISVSTKMTLIGNGSKNQNDSENINITNQKNEHDTMSITQTNTSLVDHTGPETIDTQNGSLEIKPCEKIIISQDEVQNLEYSFASSDTNENEINGFVGKSNEIATDVGLVDKQKGKSKIEMHKKIKILQDYTLTQHINLERSHDYNECSDSVLSDSFEEPFEDSGSEYLPSEHEDVPESSKKKKRKPKNYTKYHKTNEDRREGEVDPSLNFTNLSIPSTSDIKISFDVPENSKKKKYEQKDDRISHKKNDETCDGEVNSSEVNALNFTNLSIPSISDVRISLDTISEHNKNKRIYDKTHCCYLCNKKCLKMARHLELKHPNEVAVAKILAKEKNSPERRKDFLELIRVGDFYHNMEVLSSKNGTLILCRRPPIGTGNILTYNNFGPCPYCLGFMAKSFLLRHAKGCTLGKYSKNTSVKYVRLVSNSLVNSMLFNGDSKFRSHILDTFCNDEISAVCRTDSLILGVGMLLFEKHANSQKELIRQSMRQLARLLQVVRGTNPEFSNKNLKYFIDPMHFDVIINSVKLLCKANIKPSEKTDYGIPSLALKIGHSLRKCIGFLRGQSLRGGDFQEDKKLSSFLQLLDLEWEIRVSSNALSTLVKRKINSTSLLPLTQDLMKLNKYLTNEMSIFMVLLQKNPCETVAWLKLAQATLSRIILFNKRRGGEMSRMTISQYASNPNWSEESTQELQESLTPLERDLAQSMKLVQIPGKRGRTVPVLLREEMVAAINILISTRLSVGVNAHNPYIFARPNKDSMHNIRGPDALRTVVESAGLVSPKAITSTKLRKYTATVCQIFNLQEREIDWLARHMGHDVRVHRDFYRLHESAVELTKISRILMTVDSGDVSKFKGRSLEEIDLQDFPDVEESEVSDEESESDHEQQHDLKSNEPRTSQVRTEFKQGKPMKKNKRGVRPWSEEEKSAIIQFFQSSIKKKIVPGKVLCEECISNSNGALSERRWKDVKYYVKNYITKLSRVISKPI